MKIYGQTDIKQKYFKDLKLGDIFSFIKDITPVYTKVYMRGGHTCTDKTAINLETGIIYSFDLNEPVAIHENCILKLNTIERLPN